ncbi:MAG: hypothetical protein U1C12_01760 [Patescibacteria group bacterium]|nr:hypothetical protein [Patescibacteria group bacterium]
MTKQYVYAFLFLAPVFGVVSLVSAEDASLDTSIDTRTVQVETRTRVKTDLRAAYEAQRIRLEAQREKMRVEAEARRATATARGDEAQAKRETMRVEFEAKRAELDAKRESKRVEAESRRASSTAKRVEFQQNIAKRKVEHTAKVILATIERLEKIIVRIESRIIKVKARGGVTSESEGFVAAAKVNLSDARIAVNAFASIDLSSDKAAENFERIRTAAAEAREHIRAAHQNLMMAIRSLGSIEINVKVEDSVE